MNAGAYKSDFSQIIEEVYALKDGTIVKIPKEELDFHYRHSDFQVHRDWIILGARMKLQPGDQKEIRDLMDKPSAGSMFRNPESAQAWELIEKIGFRGKKIGGAMVSDKHANFIVNDDGASAKDIKELVEMIQKEVKERFGIDLITEVERFNWKI